MATSELFKWEVFVTPGIPIAQATRPEGIQQTYFQAMASTLILSPPTSRAARWRGQHR